MTKSSGQKQHAKRRFQERYGIKLSQFVWDTILHKIRSKQAKLVRKQSLRVKIYDVTFDLRQEDISDYAKPGTTLVRVVYDKTRGNIVSALPLGINDFSEIDF